jgi:hypothetical protein
MSRKRITASEDPTTLLLPREILDMMGVGDGDEVDVSVEPKGRRYVKG